VPLGGIRQAHLLLAAERAQVARDAGREPPGIHARRQMRVQPMSQTQAAPHPGLASAEKFSHRVGREALGLDQRGDHPRLIHGAGGFASDVGLEQPSLHGCGAGHGFDDDGNLGRSLRLPARQPFESIQNFEGTVRRLGNAQRKLRQLARIGAFSPQRRKRRAKLLKRDDPNRDHRLASAPGASLGLSTGKS
jgi:hypothetical protein